MADDAAAPEGELSKTTAAEPESTAVEETGAVADKPADKPADDGTTTPETSDDEAAEDEAAEDEGAEDEGAEDLDDDLGDEAPAKPRLSHVQMATIAGLVLVLALGGLTGWLGFRAYESRKADEQRNLFLQVGRQGALNLTSINFEHAEADVQRILDSATGTFYDDFQQRAQPFIEVVKQAQSKSEGTIAEAGLESASENGAEVLVAVTVKSSNAGAPEQQPRAWRMRLTVEKVDDQAKVSNVEFVP
ncbi:Mce protein [Mycobacterium sp.]|uniref:Mce protein n=1 Tax=Mycobacterium sp. TaxID=1785 RepID=UPI002D8B11D3|nr:Mce protein [Mycobacterium sp.]